MEKPGLIKVFFESLMFHWPFNVIFFEYFKVFRSDKPHDFVFQNKTYPYFYRQYNQTWRNERVVEIPIIKSIVDQYQGGNILEVGNVLSHYFAVSHDVLDKDEKNQTIINQDVVDFIPAKKYDLVVSISTLEHVGWDEKPKTKDKFLDALANLKKYLAPGGMLVFTFPLGYNPEFDKAFWEKRFGLTESYCLKRISKLNKWQEIDCEQARSIAYDHPYHAGNAVVIAFNKTD